MEYALRSSDQLTWEHRIKLITALTQLKQLNVKLFETKDAAAYFKISTTYASHLLNRLAKEDQLIKISRGLWAFPNVDRLLLPEYLSSPSPSYVSLYSALHYHGAITQIPEDVFAVTLGRTTHTQTPIGTFHLYRVYPKLFTGFEQHEPNYVKVASVEKAFIDLVYLNTIHPELSLSLPELELDGLFDATKVKQFIETCFPAQKQLSILKTLSLLLIRAGFNLM